jgi:hypothetical protein
MSEHKPIIFLAALTGVGCIFLVVFSVVMSAKESDHEHFRAASTALWTEFAVAYSFGFVVLVCFCVLLRPEIAKVVLFFFLQNTLTVSVSGSAFYFFTDTKAQYPNGPNLSPQLYLAVFGAIGGVAGLLGMALYERIAKEWTFRRVLFLGNVALIAIHLSMCLVFARKNLKESNGRTNWLLPVHIPDAVFLISNSALSAVVSQFTYLPWTVLSAQLVPKDVECTVCAVLGGALSLSQMLQNYSGALLLHLLKCEPDGSANEAAQFDNLWIASAIGSVGPEVGIEEYRNNLIGISREFHRNCMYF